MHARSVVACGLDRQTGEVFEHRLTPSHDEITAWIQSLPGPAATVYEAGPTGFGLARSLQAAGIACEVAAPSKLMRPSGDRVKTDARDARHLARLLMLGDVTPVAIPTREQEAARDLVRTREDCRGDLMSTRHRLSKLLLRQGIIYSGGKAWTGKHELWLRAQRVDSAPLQLAYDTCFEAMLATMDRRDRLDHAIEQMAADSEFTPVVNRLCCVRGIATLTAVLADSPARSRASRMAASLTASETFSSTAIFSSSRQPVGGFLNPLARFGFHSWGVAAVMGTHATAVNRCAFASVAVLAVRGATMRLHFRFGVGPPFFTPLDDRYRCREVAHGFMIAPFAGLRGFCLSLSPRTSAPIR
ncbi:MAG: IS110 family transposase, partial [Candidatus Sericytochromatia bacterium]